MATRFTRSQSPRTLPVSEILYHFRCTVGTDALNALEDRDDDWRRENDALRAGNRALESDYSDLLLRHQWFKEEHASMRRTMEKETEWLQAKVRCLEADVLDLEMANKQELDRVLKEKGVLEAKLHTAAIQRCKLESLVPTSVAVKKETDNFDHVPGRVKKGQGRMARASDAVQDFGRKRKRLQGEVCNMKRENSEGTLTISNEKMAVEAEKRRLEEKGKVMIEELNRKVKALLTEKADIEAELRRTASKLSIETERNKRTEEEMKEKISNLADKCEALETEKGGVEADLCEALHEKTVLGGLKSKMELDFKDRVSELVKRIEVLETGKRESEAKLCKANQENKSEIERIMKEKMDLEAELGHALHENTILTRMELEYKDKVSELGNRIEFLETENEEIEAKLCKANHEKKSEIERILKDKMALQVQMREAERQVKALEMGKNQSKQSNKEKQQIIYKLSKEKTYLLKEKTDLEAEIRKVVDQRKMANEGNQELINSIYKENTNLKDETRRVKEEGRETRKKEAEKQVKTTDDLKREKRELEAKVRKMSEEMGRMLKEKTDLEAEIRKVADQRKMGNEGNQELINSINKENTNLKDEIRRVKEESQKTRKKEAEKQVKTTDDLKRELEAKVRKMSEEMGRVLKEKTDLLKDKTDLEAEIRKVGNQRKMANEGNRVLINSIYKENTNLKDEIWRVKEEIQKSRKEAEKQVKTTDDLKREKRELEEKVSKMSEEMGRVLKEKMDWEAEKNIMISELNKTIDVLKRKIAQLESELCQIKEGKSEEMEIILKKKKIMEDENKEKFLELTERVEVLMREKREMEAQFFEANKDKSEEMQKILNENIAMLAEKSASEEKASKKSLELAKRIGILEMEKRGLEAEIMDKDEVIKVVAEENTCLENEIKKLNMELANSLPSMSNKEEEQFSLPSMSNKEEEQFSLPVHHPGNVGMLTAISWQAKGKKSVGACKRKRTSVSNRKCKRQFSEGSGILNSSSGGEVEGASENRELAVWETDEDMLAAFESDPELCLKAVCALYRQHLLIADTITTTRSTRRGFKPAYSAKAVALAEYLVDEDPEGRLRKTVAEVEHLDPLIVRECRDIAEQHYKQLFELYNNKQDPSFLS